MYRRRRFPGAALGGGMRNPGGGRRRGGTNMYAAMLGMDLVNRILQLPYKPPVTLALIALNVAVHFCPEVLVGFLPGRLLFGSSTDVCLSPRAVFEAWDKWGEVDAVRLFGSALVHGDDMHLLYNMGSLLLKGVALETPMASLDFALLVAGLWALSHSLVVAVTFALGNAGYPGPFHSCAVGFSAVLFALKYVLSRRGPPHQVQVGGFGGFIMDSRWATWAELLLIQLIVPNVSFMGHLCGILAGVLWVHCGAAVTSLVRAPAAAAAAMGVPLAGAAPGGRPSYTYSSGTASAPPSPPPPRPPPTAPGAAEHSPGVEVEVEDEDAQVQEAIRRSLDESRGTGASAARAGARGAARDEADWVHVRGGSGGGGSGGGGGGGGGAAGVSEAEIRRRRLQRFGAAS